MSILKCFLAVETLFFIFCHRYDFNVVKCKVNSSSFGALVNVVVIHRIVNLRNLLFSEAKITRSPPRVTDMYVYKCCTQIY